MTPLTLFSVPVALSLWAILSVLFVVLALWILGVRDWRCYLVALLWPFNREAIEFGAIDAPLVLAVAVSGAIAILLCGRRLEPGLRSH